MTATASHIKFLVVDLFCGAGGVTTGIENARDANGRKICKVIACVNHDPIAIASHAANHPETLHFTEDITLLDVTKLLAHVRKMQRRYPFAKLILWASLECTNFSNAKGGLPRDADSRTLANHLFRYLDALQPDYLMIENVKEFMAWGPLVPKVVKDKKNGDYCPLRVDKKTGNLGVYLIPESRDKGKDFIRWTNKIQEYGYSFQYRKLNSANYGAHTDRTRFFAIFGKKGLPVVFPQPTHSKRTDGELNNTKHWKPVREVLDLHEQGHSIFDRKKPLVDRTLKRILAGLEKYVANGDKEWLVKYLSNSPKTGFSVGASTGEPSPTVTAQGRLALAQPIFLVNYQGLSHSNSPDEPAPTIMTKEKLALASPVFLSKYFSGNPDSKNISVEGPAGAITTKDHHAVVFLDKYFGTGVAQSIEQPAPTLTTSDRLSQVTAVWLDRNYTGEEHHQDIERPCGVLTKTPPYRLVTTQWLDKRYNGAHNHQDIEKPSGTLTAVPKMALVTPWLMDTQFDNIGHSIEEPSPTLVASRKHFYLVNPQYDNGGSSVDNPCFTLIARMDKMPPSLITTDTGDALILIYPKDSETMQKIKLFMAAHGIADIKMRMLYIRELKRITGLPEDYILKGGQNDQKKFIGNAVPPIVPQRMTEALAYANTGSEQIFNFKNNNYMTEQEVLDLMKSSKDKHDWNLNCDKVKAAFEGKYPDFWWDKVIQSGLADETLGKGASEISIVAI